MYANIFFTSNRILDMAKYSMFDTWYTYLQPNLDNLELVLTDVSSSILLFYTCYFSNYILFSFFQTDSFVIKFRKNGQSVDQILYEMQQKFNMFDFSN